MSTPVDSISPFHFGQPGRRLFGIFHPPEGPPTLDRPGAVLCKPFGQEAIRAHRMMRVLAERLARAGHPVLRFDYFGTGDSMGDDLDGDLEGWATDVLEADRELQSRPGAGRTVWIAMRLGGAVALRAAQLAPEGLERLILWDPILDGERYLRNLRERHVMSLGDAFSVMPKPAPSVLALEPGRYRDEAIGFAVSPLLREQVSLLSPTGQYWPARPSSITVLHDPAGSDGLDLSEACAGTSGRVKLVTLRHGTDWTSDSADGALVSGPALFQLVEHARLPE